MIIYKITNNINGKVYIGQTINSLQARWHRHQTDALNNVLNTHFARAIRYYGADAFSAEVIDTASTQEELTKKEHDWIIYYDSVENGYNSTDAEWKSGGNTYQTKTPEEMAIIKQKLSESKKGEKNPNSTKVKCKNINTNEEYHFDTQAEMQKFFNESNHQFCSRRCRGIIKSLYNNEWLIAYEENNYPTEYNIKGNKHNRTGAKIKVTNLETNEIQYFKSYREAEEYIPKPRKRISDIAQNKRPQDNDYLIELV